MNKNTHHKEDVSDIEDYFKSLPSSNPLSIKQSSVNDISSKERFSVKGKVVCLGRSQRLEWLDKWPTEKEKIAYHLAIGLDDEINLSYYKTLARERRSDFLKNCLRITYEADERGVINKTLPAYFTGVVTNRTEQQQRLAEYKERVLNHTS